MTVKNLNEYCELLGDPYHDGKVTGINISSNEFHVEIYRPEYNLLTNIKIFGVRDFGIYPLCFGAIISNIRAIKTNQLENPTLYTNLTGKGGLLDTLMGGQIPEEDIIKHKDHFIKKMGDSYVFLFEFSYGGSMVVVGNDWELTKKDL